MGDVVAMSNSGCLPSSKILCMAQMFIAKVIEKVLVRGDFVTTEWAQSLLQTVDDKVRRTDTGLAHCPKVQSMVP